jgi:hypothetical protein
MPPSLPEAHRLQQQRLRKAVAQRVEALWRGLPGYDDADAEVFRKEAAAIVKAGQRSSISTVDAYLARYMKRAALGLDADQIIGNLRGGVPGEDVYRRPFVTAWTALKDGAQWADAVEAGLSHALASVEGDIQMAARQAASDVGQADERIHGYARVTGGGACELCVIASTQRYHVEDLMPIHNRCGCTVEPITEPTGRVIERRTRIETDDLTVEIRDHDELGPTLTNADHDFTEM